MGDDQPLEFESYWACDCSLGELDRFLSKSVPDHFYTVTTVNILWTSCKLYAKKMLLPYFLGENYSPPMILREHGSLFK